jgi:hypothetical protein
MNTEKKTTTESYSNFKELFKVAAHYEAFGELKTPNVFIAKEGLYEIKFCEWLREKKDMEWGNEGQYRTFLTKEFFLEFLKYEKEQEQELIAEQEREKESWQIETHSQAKTIKAPVLGLFCWMLDDAGIIKKDEAENIEKYCERICSEFNLTYKIRISKAFYNSDNKRNRVKVKEQILPLINEDVKKRFYSYLDNQQKVNQKLYG